MSRQTDLTTITVVALVLEEHQGNILIQKRKKGTHLAGFWEFPGGKTKKGEDLLQALKREIKEEINYLPPNPKHLKTLTHHYPDRSINLVFYKQEALNPKVSNSENQIIKWVHKSTLNNIRMPDGNQSIVKIVSSLS